MPYLQTNDIQTSASRLGFGKESGRIWGRQGGCAKHCNPPPVFGQVVDICLQLLYSPDFPMDVDVLGPSVRAFSLK